MAQMVSTYQTHLKKEQVWQSVATTIKRCNYQNN